MVNYLEMAKDSSKDKSTFTTTRKLFRCLFWRDKYHFNPCSANRNKSAFLHKFFYILVQRRIMSFNPFILLCLERKTSLINLISSDQLKPKLISVFILCFGRRGLTTKVSRCLEIFFWNIVALFKNVSCTGMWQRLLCEQAEVQCINSPPRVRTLEICVFPNVSHSRLLYLNWWYDTWEHANVNWGYSFISCMVATQLLPHFRIVSA